MSVRHWVAERRFPLLAAAALIVFEMISTLWVGPAILHVSHWSLPEDLWGTLVAARRLLHGDLAGLYTPPTALITFPGGALLLVPLAALLAAAGIQLGPNWAIAAHPTAWLLAGPYQIIVSSVALLAVDDIASRSGVIPRNRAVLAFAEAVALWGVAVRWGHPEDAVAVGLFLYAIRDLALPRAKGRIKRRPEASEASTAWWAGAAIAVQPLVLLALPILLVVVDWRRMPGFLIRAAAPATALLAASAVANWRATLHAVTNQPNSPSVDHPTLWESIAPHMPGGMVAAGPARLLAIAIACGFALILRRRWSVERIPVIELLWWTALALALRSVFEPVMVSYYFWPVITVALAAAAASWWQLLATSIAAITLTMVAQGNWHSPWIWWMPLLACMAVTLVLAYPGTPATKMQNG
jgi:hypothetical protein